MAGPLKRLRRIPRRWKDSLAGSRYTAVQNLQNRLKGHAVELGYADGMYHVRDGNEVLYFPVKTRSRKYGRGIYHRLDQLAEQYFLAEVPIAPGDRVIDCGANIGEIGRYLLNREPALNYCAFEPAPAEYQCLARNLPNADVRREGLWNAEGTLKFYLKSVTADSSLIEMDDYDSVVDVRCQRLEEAISPGPVKLLKVEAEGAEPEVLEGAGRLLASCAYIVVDAGPERGRAKEETAPAVINYLVPRGFRLVCMSHSRIVLLFQRADPSHSRV